MLTALIISRDKGCHLKKKKKGFLLFIRVLSSAKALVRTCVRTDTLVFSRDEFVVATVQGIRPAGNTSVFKSENQTSNRNRSVKNKIKLLPNVWPTYQRDGCRYFVLCYYKDCIGFNTFLPSIAIDRDNVESLSTVQCIRIVELIFEQCRWTI